jgi:acyl phosphate:glycerol-3-phosphate acyltransferase
MNALLWLLDVAIAFAVGSIPFGYLVGRFFYRTDIRAQGSGNIGAMNALRTLGKRGAAIVLVLDAIKGFVPVFFAARWSHNEPITATVAIAAVLGHCFSPWLGWKGGKGVATSFGAIFGLSWKAGLVAVGGWVIGALATQYSSVGSMLGNLTAPFALWFFCESWAYTIYGVFAALFIMYTHRENLARLRAGTESRIRFSRVRPDA